jgi:hypothetical protein
MYSATLLVRADRRDQRALPKREGTPDHVDAMWVRAFIKDSLLGFVHERKHHPEQSHLTKDIFLTICNMPELSILATPAPYHIIA